MLCVRSISFVDRAETEDLWLYHLKKQWYFGHLIAVRVQDPTGKMLGSSIPIPFTPTLEDTARFGLSWVVPDAVEQPELSDDRGAGNAHAEESADNVLLASPGTPAAQSEPFASVSMTRPTALPTPSDPSSQEEKVTPEATPAADPAKETSTTIQEAESPPAKPPQHAEEAEKTDNGKAEKTDNGKEQKEVHATEPESHHTALDAATAAAPPPSKSAPPTSPFASSAVEATAASASPDAAASEMHAATEEPSPCDDTSAAAEVHTPTAPSTPPPVLPQASDTPTPTFSSCMPIDIHSSAKGPLAFEVITASGTKVGMAEANVQAILDRASSGAPAVQHYAVVVTPAKAKPKDKYHTTIFAVLEFSVVVGTTDVDAAIALAVGARTATIPAALDVGATCAFSTRTFYFPSSFLTGTGEYIVTNVLCVESRSNNPVRLEVALPEDLKSVGVLPEKKVIITKKGDRALFAFTWSVFSPYVNTDGGKDSDADRNPVGLHVLIRDGAENKAPMDIELVGDLPPVTAETVGPYMFYLNHACVSNISYSAVDAACLADILPISLVTRANA